MLLTDDNTDRINNQVKSNLLHRTVGHELADDLQIGIRTNFVLKGTSNANGDNLFDEDGNQLNGGDVFDGTYSFDLEFEKEFSDYGLAFLHLKAGDNVGADRSLKVFSGVNTIEFDSDNAVDVTEIWYEHYFDSMPLTLTAGKIDPTFYIDNNEYASDGTSQFLGGIFGGFSYN